MSLSHAVLTSLLEKPTSGYDLARRFDKSIGFFWHATHQQIYRELARMEAAGWIESYAATDAGKTRKRNYQVLQRGEQELRRWAQEPSNPIDLRDELMVRLRADATLGALGLEAELKRRMALHRLKLQTYRGIEARDFLNNGDLARGGRIHHMILKKGILYEQSSLDWLQEVLNFLEEPIDAIARESAEHKDVFTKLK
jgi:DNA-binding PadR family transcriptional regulator